MSDEIISSLKSATGWNNINKVEDAYVISFSMKDLSLIKGLVPQDGNFALAFEEFRDIHISFVIQMDNITYQYWTVNGRLHRTKDRPAFILHDPKDGKTIRRWYWYGMLHRENGPARETIKGFDVDYEFSKTHYLESFESMRQEWIKESMKQLYPHPHEATMLNGKVIRNKETKQVDDWNDVCAVSHDRLVITWKHDKNQAHSDLLLPMQMSCTDLSENYKKGELVSRHCDGFDAAWRRRGTCFIESDTELKDFNAVVQASMLSDFNFMGSPFFKNEEAEFVLLSEFDRLVNK